MVGRALERADQTTRLLDTRFHPGAAIAAVDADLDAGHWNALLRAAAGYHAYRREHPTATSRWKCRIPAGQHRIPSLGGLNLAQIEWHLSQLRLRYHLRGCAQALERVDNLCGSLTQEGVADLVARGLSPFLDWMQREIGALHARCDRRVVRGLGNPGAGSQPSLAEPHRRTNFPAEWPVIPASGKSDPTCHGRRRPIGADLRGVGTGGASRVMAGAGP